MPEVLIIEPCIINHGDDRGGIHNDSGEVVVCNKENALKLAHMGRCLFVSREDDPDKAGIYTASKEMLKAAQDMAKARAKKSGGEAAAGGPENQA